MVGAGACLFVVTVVLAFAEQAAIAHAANVPYWSTMQQIQMHQNFAPAENMEVGINQNFSTFSLMSDYSNFQMGGGQTNPAGIPPPPNYLSTPDSLMSPSSLSPCMSLGLNLTGDRRKHFARIKYSRPPSGRRSNTSATAAAAAAGW